MHFKARVRVTPNGLENCVLSTENPDNYLEILYSRVSFHH